MWTPSLSKAFGSNQLRQRIIKIYDAHSDSGSHSQCSWNSPASSRASLTGRHFTLPRAPAISCPSRSCQNTSVVLDNGKTEPSSDTGAKVGIWVLQHMLSPPPHSRYQ